MFDKGFFGDIFNFDGDGKLDMFEQSADFCAFMDMIDEDKESDEEDLED